jgi:hypothetical protein
LVVKDENEVVSPGREESSRLGRVFARRAGHDRPRRWRTSGIWTWAIAGAS